MSVTPTCRTPLPLESFFSVRGGSAVNELPKVEVRANDEDRDRSIETIFHALSYLGQSRDRNDICAFYLLHQIFVAVTRHDKISDWLSLDAMLDYARQKAIATATR